MLQSELMVIARDGKFLSRINYLVTKAAIAKLNAETPLAEDILLGQRILKGEENMSRWAVAAVTNPSIAAGAHTPSGDTITESDLEFTINSLWEAFAK